MFRLKFTYTEETVDVLLLTLIGHNLLCDRYDEFMLLYKDATNYRSTVYKLCLLHAQNVTDSKDHCQYECKCYSTVPCEINILIVQPRERILYDIIPTGSDTFVT